MLADLNPQRCVANLSEIVGSAIDLACESSSFVTGDDIAVSGECIPQERERARHG